MCKCCWGMLRACFAECGYARTSTYAAEEHYMQQRRACCVGAGMAYVSVLCVFWIATITLLVVALSLYTIAAFGPAVASTVR